MEVSDVAGAEESKMVKVKSYIDSLMGGWGGIVRNENREAVINIFGLAFIVVS